MTLATLTSTTRSFLRDNPKYFEVELGVLNVLTVRLPHPLIMGKSVQVYVATPGAEEDDPWTSELTTAWELDARNGLLKITDAALLNKRLLVAAYHYTWFADEDLALAVGQSAAETVYNTNGTVDKIEGIYEEVTALGAATRALWSLAIELSLDIDVSTPEGMYIPARQRYQQVLQMMSTIEGEYATRAAALNIGLGQLEQFSLRRIAYLTNRYVPMYKAREVDDYRWPERLHPVIPDGTMDAGSSTPDVIEITESSTAEERYRGGQDIGWVSIGTRGDEWLDRI